MSNELVQITESEKQIVPKPVPTATRGIHKMSNIS